MTLLSPLDISPKFCNMGETGGELIMGIFDIFKSRERRTFEAISQIQISANRAISNNKNKIRIAISTISTITLPDDLNSYCARSASELTKHIVKSSGNKLDNDTDLLVGGIFCFIFSNHFSYITNGDFEIVSTVAASDLTINPRDMLEVIPTVIHGYNEMASENAEVLSLTGNCCAAWVNEPSLENLSLMIKLYDHCRGDVE